MDWLVAHSVSVSHTERSSSCWRLVRRHCPDCARSRSIPSFSRFTLIASLLSGLLFGFIPVLKYSGPRLVTALRGATRTSSHSRERHRARNLLVVVQVALALVLLVASGLMIRTFQILRNVQPGFVRPGEVQMLRVSIPDPVEADAVRVARIHNDILEKVAALPGVESAALVSSAPLERFDSNDPVSAEDKVYAPTEIPPIRRFKFVSPGLLSNGRHSARSSDETSPGPTCSTTVG